MCSVLGKTPTNCTIQCTCSSPSLSVLAFSNLIVCSPAPALYSVKYSDKRKDNIPLYCNILHWKMTRPTEMPRFCGWDWRLWLFNHVIKLSSHFTMLISDWLKRFEDVTQNWGSLGNESLLEWLARPECLRLVVGFYFVSLLFIWNQYQINQSSWGRIARLFNTTCVDRYHYITNKLRLRSEGACFTACISCYLVRGARHENVLTWNNIFCDTWHENISRNLKFGIV